MTSIPGPSEPNEYDEILAKRRQQSDQLMAASFNQAVKADPAKARAASKLAGDLGLPTDVVERNVDDVRAIMARREFEMEDVARHSPIFARQLRDPDFARQVSDEWKGISTLERMGYAEQTGRLNYERSRIGFAMYAGMESAADYRRMAEINAQLKILPPTEGFFANAAEILGGMAPSFGKASVGGLIGAGMGAMGGPAATVTAPAGFVIGATTAFALDSATSIAGAQYLALIDKQVSPGQARAYATGVGVIGGALDTVGLKFVTAPIRSRIMSKVATQVGEQLTQATYGKAGVEFVKSYVKSASGEVVTEVGQEITSILAEGAATGDWEGAGDRIAEVASKTAQGMALLALPGSTFGMVHDVHRARAAKDAQARAQGRTEAILGSKLRTENPAAFEKMAAQMDPGELHVEAMKVVDALRQADKADADAGNLSKSYAEQIDQLIPGFAEQVDEAARTGQDVTIPRAVYDTRLAGTPIGAALEPHLRQGKDAMSPAEADLRLANLPEVEETAEAQAISADEWDVQAKKIESDIAGELVAAGRKKGEARRGAVLARRMFETLAERLGDTPEAVFAKWRVKVTAMDGDADGEAFAQPAKVDSPEFKAWFGESKVVDKAGKPLVVYHAGTFDENTDVPNQPMHFGTSGAAAERAGTAAVDHWLEDAVFEFDDDLQAWFWRSGNDDSFDIRGEGGFDSEQSAREDAQEFAESLQENQQEELPVTQTYLSLQNPKRVPDQRTTAAWEVEIEKAKAEGHDGLVYTNEFEDKGSDSYVAFEPTQIKSVNNRGTFDPNDPNILRQSDRGEFNPASFTIALSKALEGKGADASTFVHELAHAFLTIYEQAAAQKLHPTIVDDFRAFLKWTGHEESAWASMTLDEKRKAHENFAANFEAYLWDGKAPDPTLKRLFGWFGKMLRNVYRAIRDQLNAQHRTDFGEDLLDLTPEIRGVFDRMLAAEDRVRATQAIRGALPIFADKASSGLSDADWAAYQDRLREADDAAVADIERRSLADMRWLRNAKSKRLREIQGEAKRVREGERQRVAAEVQKLPVHRALRWLRTGEIVNADGTKTTGQGSHQLRTDAVPEALRDQLRGKLAADGLSPDQAASMFGFDTGAELVRAIIDAPDIATRIEADTDAAMLQKHGDLVDPDRIEEAIVQAMHGEARRRFVASEMAALAGLEGGESGMRVARGAAKLAAEMSLAKRKVGQIDPRAIQMEARRASKQAQEHAKAGELREAIQAKRRQMVLTEMVDLAIEARDEIAKVRALFDSKHMGRKDADLAKTRDVDYVWVARALGAANSLSDPIAPGQAQGLVGTALEKVRAERPDLFERLTPMLAAGARQPVNFRELTLEEFRELGEVLDALYQESRQAKLLDAEGKKLDLDAARQELASQVASLPPRNPPGSSAPPGEDPGPVRRRIMGLWTIWASLKRIEHWARYMDGGRDNGPFQRLLVAPIMRATVRYRDAKAGMVRDLHTLLTEHQERNRATWNARIKGERLDHTFNGKHQILAAMLHAGSESGLRKLLVGRKWGSVLTLEDGTEVLDTRRWDAQVGDWFRDGTLNAEDVAFLNRTWKLYAKLLPEAQRTHKKLYGYEYETIAHLPTDHGKYGKLEGGYVPARIDKDVASKEIRDMDPTKLEDASFRYSVSTGKGFTIARNPLYNQPLLLDLNQHLQSMDSELRFIHLQPALADAVRLTSRGELRQALDAYDREAVTSIVTPFLQNVALQSTSRPGMWRALDWAANALRGAASLSALGFSLINAAIQISGLSNARTQIKGRFMRSALKRFFAGPPSMVRDMTGRSDYMRQRFDQSTRKLQDQLDVMASTPALQGVRTAQKALGRWAFAMQRGVQMVADTTTWHGAFEQAVADGMDDASAVERADSAVRMLQGSQNPEDLAGYEAQTPIGKLFTQFGSFSNLMLNQILSAQGIGGKARATAFALLIPALIEVVIREGLTGGPDDEDQDGVVDDWAASLGRGVVRNVAGLIPVAGPMMMALAESEGTRVASPFSTAIGGFAKGMFEAAEAVGGDDLTAAEATAIAAVFSLLGIPIAAPARHVKMLVGER